MASTRSKAILTTLAQWAVRGAAMLIFVAGVVVLLFYLAGKFSPKVAAPERTDGARQVVPQNVVVVRTVTQPVTESAVGSIRAVHETSIGSRLLARVVEVNVKAGQPVSAGEVLIRLDDTELRAKLQQATAALTAAEAHYAQTLTEERRYGQLVKDRVVSQQEFERVVTARKSAEAEVLRAREAVKEVQATLDLATIRAPMSGIVVDKKVDVGDTVTPGQVLLTLFDPQRMQLVANVRESLAHRLEVGQDIGVFVEGLNQQCVGQISEIVPQADVASRAFQVKVTGPCPPGIYSGMFGRVLIPLDEEQILVVPRRAVRRVGQLELVDVVEDGRMSRRAVRTGRTLGEDVEVLSGLQAGERVAVPTAEASSPAAGDAPRASASQEARHG